MALSEEMRHRIYSRLQELMGGEETAALMAQFPPVAWAEVATKHDVEHSMELVRGDIARLDARIDQVSGRIEQVSELLRGDIARLDARIDHIDSGLTEVARGQGEAKAALRTLFVGLVALQVSAAGLVVGVAHLI